MFQARALVPALLALTFATPALGSECAVPEECRARTGGAFITLSWGNAVVTVWSEDDAFIEGAVNHMANGTSEIPVFEKVVAEVGCDLQWSWTVSPVAYWAETTVEVCDAHPTYIESDPQGWIDSVGYWCPWGTSVVAVDDRR